MPAPLGPEIHVSSSLCPQQKAGTLLHEIIHTIADYGGGDCSEADVRVLEQGLVGLFRDNPQLIRSILKAVAP